MHRRLRQYFITCAVTTGLLAATMLATQVTASAAPSACVLNTHISSFTATGSPFAGGGTRFSWSVAKGCPEVEVSLTSAAGSTVGATGSVLANPTVTSSYTLKAKLGSTTKMLATRYALGAKVIGYSQSRGGLIASNASGPTGDAARLITHRIASSLSEQAKVGLLGKTVEVHIIPSHLPLTVLPPWKYLHNVSTCQGKPDTCVEDRLWNDVRGIGGTKIGTDRIAMAVAAEELVFMPSKPPTHGLGHILAHEFGHIPLQYASDSFRTTVNNIRLARIATAGVDFLGLEHYTRSDVEEYWAEGTAALFTYPYQDEPLYVEEFTPSWLAENDPALLAKLNVFYPNR